MSDRIIFLDVDGVLNDLAWCRDAHTCSPGARADFIDATRVALLMQVIEATDARVVLSTSWVLSEGYEETVDALEEAGLPRGLILGATPRKMSSARHTEITWWLERGAPPAGILILEDDWPMHDLEPWTLRTRWAAPGGLQPEDVARAIEILHSPPPAR